MKKLLAILCAVMLVLTCSISVFAAGPYTITVTNAENGKIYSAYKMLDLETNGSAYYYTVATGWEAFFTGSGAGTAYVDIDTNGAVTLKTGADVAALAAAAITYVKANVLTAAASGTAGATPLELTVAEPGYYLVDSNLGSLCALNTANPNADVKEKNKVPSVDKVIDEGAGVGSNTASIGDTIPFKSTITAYKGLDNLTWYDIMSSGLTYKNDIAITVGGSALDLGTDYTLETVSGYTIVVKFTSAYLATLPNDSLGTKIEIRYSATLNEDAVVTGKVDNQAQISYGDNNDIKSAIVKTETSTFNFDLVKTDSANKLLAGAKFKLYSDAECTDANEIKLVKIDDDDYNYRVAKEGETGVEIVTMGDKLITVKGLESGTYYLKEIQAPDDYNPLTAPQSFTIGNTDLEATMKVGDPTTWEDGGVHIINNSGSELPSTGGMGTTLFIAIGSIVVLITGVVLVARKRMSKYVA